MSSKQGRRRIGEAALFKPVVVHLGNVGSSGAQKTRDYAKRFPFVSFVGIDLMAVEGSRPANWKQIQADFIKGLKKVPRNSVHVVSSEAAVGYYGPVLNQPKRNVIPYTVKTLRHAYSRLRKGGKLLIVIKGKNMLERILQCISKTSFRKENISFREMTGRESSRTASLRELSEDIIPGVFYQVIAVK